MKTLSLMLLWSFCPLFADKVPERIRTQYNERILLNKTYKEDYTEPVRSHPLSDKLVPLAQRNGDDWVALLTHVRDHGETRTQFLLLRVELFAEMIPYMMEREDAVDEGAKKRASDSLKRFEDRLRELEVWDAGRGKTPVRGPDPDGDLAFPAKLLRAREEIYRGFAGGWDWVEEYNQADLLRKRVAQDNRDWVELTRAVGASGDAKLMYLFLRTELQGNLYPLLVDLPNLHGSDRVFVKEEIQTIEENLRRLTEWWRARQEPAETTPSGQDED